MNNSLKLLLTIVLFLGFINTSQGQKIKRVEGESKLRQENHITRDEVISIAIEQAKINAIERVFGTYVEQQIDMTIDDGITSFNIIGTTKVKGEWIETTGEPDISTHIRKEKTQYGMQDVTWVSCKIKGKVRAIIPRAMLDYEILNAPNIQARTRSFING